MGLRTDVCVHAFARECKSSELACIPSELLLLHGGSSQVSELALSTSLPAVLTNLSYSEDDLCLPAVEAWAVAHVATKGGSPVKATACTCTQPHTLLTCLFSGDFP